MTKLAADQPLPKRELWRNANDPTFQGDGWRWSLSLWIPQWRARWLAGAEGTQWFRSRDEIRLDLWPLTPLQRKAVANEREAFLLEVEGRPFPHEVDTRVRHVNEQFEATVVEIDVLARLIRLDYGTGPPGWAFPNRWTRVDKG